MRKPAGPTSHDVVERVRRRFRYRKVGHAGTLDPAARGVLVLGLGRMATRHLGALMAHEKEYTAEMRLGVSTDTLDSTGAVTARGDWSGITEERLRETINAFRGERPQVPPMYSALKRGGEPLYRLARRGIDVARKPRTVVIRELELREVSLPRVVLRVVCSAGTYIRALCADIGERLGCGAHLTGLVRSRVGHFTLQSAVEMDELMHMSPEELEKRLVPVEDVSDEGAR